MSKKKIKVNGEWVFVDEKDVEDATDEEAEAAEGSEDEDTETEGDEDVELTDAEKRQIGLDAKKFGKDIAKSITEALSAKGASISGGEVEKLQKQIDNLMKYNVPQDSKLSKILGGKDVVKDMDSLTKEEKIVGFWHALVTDNKAVLKALSEGTPADGGYLFPNEFMTELVRELPEINVMRNWVRIIPMRRNAMDVTTLVSGPQVTWTSENAVKSTTTAHFGRKTLTAYKMAAILYSSDELIEDSDIFDVVQTIIGLFAEAIAGEEEKAIWQGTGTGQPTGIETTRAASGFPSITAGSNKADSVIDLFYSLPRKYRTNAAWFVHDSDVKELRKLKDANDQYLWAPGFANTPETVLGKPVVTSDWVPQGKLFFGDLRQAYFLGDRQRMTVKISNDTTQAFTQDMTAIRVVSRIAGLTVLPNAIRALISF